MYTNTPQTYQATVTYDPDKDYTAPLHQSSQDGVYTWTTV